MSSADLETVPEIDDALFSARGIETGYGELQVLYGVDVDVRDDEIVLVFGPNGAGKSTLMKALYGRLPLWDGTTEIDGTDLSEVRSNRMIEHGVGFVPQTENVFPNLTVSENLDIGAIHTEDPASRRAELFELFPRLEERLEQTAETLSGGERQMLAMARALMPDPDLLFIDEPSAGLAPQLIERTFEHIARIRDDGTAVLMIEQNVNAALSVADRGYVLDMGENRFEADAETIRESERIRDLYLGK
ncbi:ABC transporter ATP-binding protein [Halobellus sp. Atlit-38R]|uniref:ABC transporter ATP-binding protein n=1 Tax=Halobellus sp. Atlit-38R TaxID=2282131 RepID=UPI000EF25FC8|nr:ABC transporter ATP-binding protein [Halobellus sp. Atlit-38R]RLM90331.1 ABC transporter ATP-binding protein [Halobellus sp. Atlit-38R]